MESANDKQKAIKLSEENKKILAALAYAGLFFLLFFTVLYVFELDDLIYQGYGFSYNVSEFLLGSLYLVLAIAAYVYFGFKCFKILFPKPRGRFYLWSLFLCFLCYGLVFDRGIHLAHVTFFLGIPGVLILSIAFVVTEDFGSNKEKYTTRPIHLALLFTLGLGLYVESVNTTAVSFENENYLIEVSVYSLPAFLDWPVDVDVYIENKAYGKSGRFEGNFGQGPYFNLHQSITNPSVIYMLGSEDNRGADFLFDLTEGSSEFMSYSESSLDDFREGELILEFSSSTVIKKVDCFHF